MADPTGYEGAEARYRAIREGDRRNRLFTDWMLANPGKWHKPAGPGDTVHQREEDDMSGAYRRGGAINTAPYYNGGGEVEHFDVGGTPGLALNTSGPDYLAGQTNYTPNWGTQLPTNTTTPSSTSSSSSSSSSGSGSSTQQPFGYDPSSYVTNVGNWANQFYNNQNQTYNMGLDQFNKNKQIADAVTSSAMGNAGVFDDAAKAGVSRYETMYAPAMQQYLQQAQQWASPENLAYYRGQARAGVADAFGAQAKASSDSLRSYGLDPKAVASRLDGTVRTQQAAAEAGAGTSSDNTRLMQSLGLQATAIGQGQADAGVTQGFAGVGTAQRNQAINAPLATEASRQSAMGTPQGWGSMAGAELKEWPKAQLDAMHASNEQGALWNDINRTNLVGQQQAYSQGSGFGAIAGGVLGAASNMFKFSPMTIGGGGGGTPGSGTTVAHGGVIPEPDHHRLAMARGGVVPSFAGGGGVPMTETWRKFASGNAIGSPDPIGEGPGNQNDFTSGMKAGKGDSQSSPFRFNIGGGSGDGVTPSGPQGSGPGGDYQPGDLGGAGYEPFAAGNNPVGVDGPAYAHGGMTDLGQVFAGGGQPSAIQTGPIVPQSAAVPGIKGPDKVPAMVQPGEGILPKRVMQHIGQKGLQAIIDKVDRDTGAGPQPRAKGVSKPMPPQAMQTGPTFASYGAMA